MNIQGIPQGEHLLISCFEPVYTLIGAETVRLELQQAAFEGLRLCRELRLRIESIPDCENDAVSASMKKAFGVLEVNLLRILAEEPTTRCVTPSEGES